MNVAIIGARGIGKHHAKWFHLAGCRVVAFSGTSPETCRRTEAVLRGLFDFRGRHYTDYRRMFASESLDIVSICSPPAAHYEQVAAALEAGLHVYCEKPFAWPADEALRFPIPPAVDQAGVSHPVLRDLLDRARGVIALAAQNRCVVGMNAQYVAAQPAYKAMYEAARGPLETIASIYFLLESKGISGRHNTDEGIWIDMAPHALSQVIAWLPDGALDMDSIDCRITAHETTARFRYGGATVEATLRKNTTSGPRRQFGVNDFIVDYEGRADADGMFRTYLRHGERSVTTDDLVQRSIRRFLEAIGRDGVSPVVTGRDAVRNLEMSMMILERSVRGD